MCVAFSKHLQNWRYLPGNWTYGPVWCHESPADGPEEQLFSSPDFPLRCWRFDLQRDVLGQSNEPEGKG